MRSKTTLFALAAAMVIGAGCHNNGDPGTPSPNNCDPSRDACPTTGTGPTTGGTSGTGVPPTTTPTNQPPTQPPKARSR